jgi:hypothetical protein
MFVKHSLRASCPPAQDAAVGEGDDEHRDAADTHSVHPDRISLGPTSTSPVIALPAKHARSKRSVADKVDQEAGTSPRAGFVLMSASISTSMGPVVLLTAKAGLRQRRHLGLPG